MNILLKHSADVNLKDFDGNTPMHHAAFLNHTNSIRLLLGKGAGIDLKNKNMETPLDKARYWNREEAIVLLQKNDAQQLFNGEDSPSHEK